MSGIFGSGSKGKKTDDSILEDAQKAREEERKGRVRAEDQLEHTFDEIADAPVKAKMEGASEERVKQLEKQLEEVKRMLGESMKVKPVSTEQRDALKREAWKKSEIPQCSICGQYVTVCGGVPEKHTTIRVLPNRPEHYAGFPGVCWNGVWYVGAAVVVPAACAQDILATLNQYCEYRFNLNLNRGKVVGKGQRRFVAEGIPRDGVPII